MAYNDKRLKTDLEGKPIPQAYNPDIDDYEPVHSTNNALKQVIYGPNGQPISTVGNKLAVRATELETLMQGFATEGKLEQVRALLQNVSDKDFAKDETLEQVRALLNTLSTKDFATSSNQDALKTVVDDLKSELLLVKSELATIKANQLSGDQKVQLSGTKVVESAPVTGIKTVTSTVAEVFAGSSRKANRSKLIIRNLHPAVAIRIGGSGITDTIGQSVEPGASVEIDFSPSTAVLIYAVSTAGNVSVEVLEV